MAKNLQEILGYIPLTGLIEQVKTGVPDVLPPAFWNTKKQIIGDAGQYTRYAGTRQTARRAEYGSSARQRQLVEIGKFPVKLNHAFEFMRLDVKLYQSLRGYDSYNPQSFGEQEVDRQISQFRKLFDNLRMSMVYSMLAKGAIYFDVDGNLLPTSSGAALTIDYGISANNKNQLNSAITASWATASTDIPGNVRTIKKRSILLTGMPLKHVFHGENLPSYIAANTLCQAYLARHPNMNSEFLNTNEIPSGFLGLEWHPVYEAFFNDSAGTNQSWFSADAVVFTPDINAEVYEMMEGTYPVPTSLQPTDNAKDSFKLVNGMFAYGIPCHNPPTADLFCGDTSLPTWLVPDALFIGDCTP